MWVLFLTYKVTMLWDQNSSDLVINKREHVKLQENISILLSGWQKLINSWLLSRTTWCKMNLGRKILDSVLDYNNNCNANSYDRIPGPRLNAWHGLRKVSFSNLHKQWNKTSKPAREYKTHGNRIWRHMSVVQIYSMKMMLIVFSSTGY